MIACPESTVYELSPLLESPVLEIHNIELWTLFAKRHGLRATVKVQTQ
jgi:hypothetical protein